MRRWALWLLTAAAACGRDARLSAIPQPVAVGAPAPAYTATALGGEPVALGGRAAGPVLVNVWATWCTSCREEFAELEQLRQRHASGGLSVLAISVDQGGSEKVRRFADAQGVRFPVVHDREARITALYGVVGLPSTYVIGRDGTVRWAMTGSFLEARSAMESAISAAEAERNE